MKNILNKHKKIIIIGLVSTIIIILLINFNFFLSLFNKTKPITYKQEEIIKEKTNYYIKDINKEINLIEIEFSEIPKFLTISYTDNNFKNYDHFNKSYTNNNIKDNKLLVLVSTQSKIENLRFNMTNGTIENITINPNVKFDITGTIIISLLLLLIIFFTYYLINNKEILNINNIHHKTYIISMLVVTITISLLFYATYKKFSYRFGDIYEYYYTNAVLKGKLNLDYRISDQLANSENPYDTSNRNYNYIWDASYYNGKYYCYFGILPIITLLAPFKLLTGTYLTTPTACLIYSILSIIGTFILFHKIIKIYFNKITISQYIISFLFIIFGSKIFWCMHRPSFYELVSLAAYAHIIFGLYLILFKEKKITDFIGYSLLASAVLCRPTALFASILIIPKIIKKFKDKTFKIKDFIILAIPYGIFGIITMYLNYVRFNSIFEFGISYQLTTNNLYNSSFSLLNGIYGAYQYLFSSININMLPLNISDLINKIPYITDFNIENIGGGVITTSILGIILLFTPKIIKLIKEKELKIYIILSLILALFIMIFSASIGATIGRYMLDFNYIFYIVTVILCLHILKKYNNKTLNNLYIIICVISIIINFILSRTIV